jgi:hypothetical protein
MKKLVFGVLVILALILQGGPHLEETVYCEPAHTAVILVVQNQYEVDGKFYVDYVLNGELYTGVYYEDMFDDLNSACLEQAESEVQ